MTKELANKTTKLLREGQSLKDFCDLLNIHIEDINLKNETTRALISLKRLQFYYRQVESHYISFSIPKRDGGERSIQAPDHFLLKIQRLVAGILEYYFEPEECSHGFIRERSIVSNAELHTNKPYVLNVDIANFFPSIKGPRIRRVLVSEPFKFNLKMSSYILTFCTYKGALPQGAATSPILSNIVATSLDLELQKFAQVQKQTYSRYADDITFSGYRRVYNSAFFKELNRIVGSEKFKLKKSKTRIQGVNKRQEVTGIVVNEKLNVNRVYVRELRAMIHHYKTGRGPDNAYAVISGKLEFLKMVKGKDRVYKNLHSQFIDAKKKE